MDKDSELLWSLKTGLVVPAMMFVVLGVMFVDAKLYQRTEPYPPLGIAGLSSWSLIVATIAVGAAGLSLLAWKRTRRKAKVISLVVALALVTAVATWLSIVSLQGIAVPTYLQKAPGRTATSQAQQQLRMGATEGRCVTVRGDSPIDLPPPYQRCAYLNEVDYLQASSEDGFVFAPGTKSLEPDACVRHFAGPWWAEMSEGDESDGRACANSFTFEGGG